MVEEEKGETTIFERGEIPHARGSKYFSSGRFLSSTFMVHGVLCVANQVQAYPVSANAPAELTARESSFSISLDERLVPDERAYAWLSTIDVVKADRSPILAEKIPPLFFVSIDARA